MSAHTPGPWAILTNGVCVSGPDPENREVGMSGVAHCGMARRTEAENRANAQLVMAAPDLLAALTALASIDDGDEPAFWKHEAVFNAAWAAIEKATGVSA